MNALGMIELTSIPAGVQAGDAMLKAAAVELVTAQPVCAGKYIVLVTGEAAAVRESVEAGKLSGGEKLVDSMFVANIHPQVPRAINACTEIGRVASVGVIGGVFALRGRAGSRCGRQGRRRAADGGAPRARAWREIVHCPHRRDRLRAGRDRRCARRRRDGWADE